MSYHTTEVGDGSILVGVGVEQHLCVGVDGYVRLHVLLALAQELGDGLDLRLRLWVGATVGVVARVGGGAFLWVEEKESRVHSKPSSYCSLLEYLSLSQNYTDLSFCRYVCYFLNVRLPSPGGQMATKNPKLLSQHKIFNALLLPP